MLSDIATTAMLFLMCVGGIFDLLTMRIPNLIPIAVSVLFLVFSVLTGMPLLDIGIHTFLAGLTFLAGFFLFSVGVMGGGDGKLASAGVLWFGPNHAVDFILVSLCLGALLGLVFAGLRRIIPGNRLGPDHWFGQWLHGLHTLPFGVAMAVAAFVVSAQLVTFSFP